MHSQLPASAGSINTPKKNKPNQQLLPTLFDRLFDNAPHKLKESELEYAVDKKQMMNIVRRDLNINRAIELLDFFHPENVSRSIKRSLKWPIK